MAMPQWKVTYECYGGRNLGSKIVEAMSEQEAESKVLWSFRGNDTFDRIVSVERVPS
jgi:hypothetical protein